MLKNIYFQISDIGTNFTLKTFCRIHKELLRENRLFHIDFSDLFPEYPPLNFNTNLYNDTWIIGDRTKNNKAIQLPQFSEILTKLQEYITSNNIAHLLVFIHSKDLSDTLPELLKLKQYFSSAKFHFQETKVELLRERNCLSNISLLAFTDLKMKIKFQQYFSPCYIRLDDYQQFSPATTQIKKIFNDETIPQKIFSNECECIQEWLDFAGLTIPLNSKPIPTATFSPEVLSFLYAIYEDYHSAEQLDFSHEYSFLYAFSSNTELYSYHSKAQKKLIDKTFPLQDVINTNQFSDIDCSEKSLRLTCDNALFLAKRLSPAIRKLIINQIDFSKLPYKSITTQYAYLAILAAENKFDGNEIDNFIFRPKGRINDGEKAAYTNDQPLLTVYTATYNHAKYIKQCIDSVLNQKINVPFVHIISDDCSTDGTQEILKTYAEKYPHIKLILKEKNASIKNQLSIMNTITTKYFAVCDGDDFYTDENKLAEQVSLLEKNPTMNMSFHSTYVYYESNNTISAIHPTSLKDFTPKDIFYTNSLIITNLAQSSSVMFRSKISKGLYASYPFLTGPYDWATNIIYSYKSKMGFINKIMSLYRRHKSANYIETKNNIAKYIIINCFNELFFCSVLDTYTEEKYHTLFMQKVFSRLVTFYCSDEVEKIDKQKYNTIKNNIEKCFPEYLTEFNKQLHKLKNTQSTK